MKLGKVARQLPLRLAAGSYVINSGLSKWGADEAAAKQLRDFAAGTYPFLARLEPRDFVKLLAAGELALGAAVLVLPGTVAGTGLAAFSAGLLGLYLRTPGMRQEGSLRPTEQGIALAKDIWLLGIGAALVADDLVLEDEQS